MFTELIERDKTAQWRAEAKAHGWEWVEMVDSRQSRSLYKHSCGHMQLFATASMRKGQIKCGHCQEEKFKSEATAKGWTWLSQFAYRQSLYQHQCGHTQVVETSNMRRCGAKCQHCWLEKIKAEATANGWFWISQVDEDYGRYQHQCGHEQDVQMTNMRRTMVQCSHCQEEKLKSEAQNGWTWLGQVAWYYGLYQHRCGHTQKITMGNMRKGMVACHACEASWATKPSNLYVLYISLQGEALVKVGISGNLDHRKNCYGLPPEAEVTTLKTVPFATGLEAKAAEQKVLKKFRKHQLKNIDHIMSRSGATECFCPSVLDQILDAVEQLEINQCKIAS
jgi:hypothetical protein